MMDDVMELLFKNNGSLMSCHIASQAESFGSLKFFTDY